MGFKEVMKKEILKFLSVLFVLFLSVTHSVFALDYTNGHFEKINADFPVFGQPIKLNNGKILIISDSKIISFNPTTNKFEKITRGLLQLMCTIPKYWKIY